MSGASSCSLLATCLAGGLHFLLEEANIHGRAMGCERAYVATGGHNCLGPGWRDSEDLDRD